MSLKEILHSTYNLLDTEANRNLNNKHQKIISLNSNRNIYRRFEIKESRYMVQLEIGEMETQMERPWYLLTPTSFRSKV